MPPKKNQDAIALLKEDHKKVKGLLSELEETSEKGVKKREKLLAQIEKEVKVHTQIEEEIFYPAYREAVTKKDDRKLFFEATYEHHVVDLVMPELKRTNPSSEQFGAKAKVLKELIEHHADEEEKEMFPKARKVLNAEDLRELGAERERRTKELMKKFLG